MYNTKGAALCHDPKLLTVVTWCVKNLHLFYLQIVPIFLSAHSVASALNLVVDKIFLNSKVGPKIIIPLDKFWTQAVYTAHTMQYKFTCYQLWYCLCLCLTVIRQVRLCVLCYVFCCRC